ncbi:major facilitator superfamily domain-containing protein [Aspergillus novoparasiticus]|uniref:Major facilitator superfamily domain-containing protein n=1 Tax=Aspergillus novoparasiticus TaxID=986946 RepID=A0A5N6F3R2_9EURO|nr:major facilitator superfamily domain-containing protein [Aspergillus novoparasiticus]
MARKPRLREESWVTFVTRKAPSSRSCSACHHLYHRIGNLLAGLLTVCIPVIAADLHILPVLQLWPTAAFALACGCVLLPSGAAADVLGCRRACLLGGLLQTASALGAGLSATGTQLIALRVIAGVAASFCLPSAVGVTAHIFPANSSPRRLSIAFAAMGGGQAVGFGLGLALGGVFSDTIGWRWGFYVTAILNSVVLALALWVMPKSADGGPLEQTSLSRLRRDVDWIGALLISACLALRSYELAVATGSDADRSMRQSLNTVLLCSALALIAIFVLWMRRQVRLSRPALIPNSLWTNVPFTAVCITVFLVWGTLNANVRGTSTLTASLYFMPAPVCDLLMNAAIGISLPYLKSSIAVPAGCLMSGIAPLLLGTLCGVNGPGYCCGAFQAMALKPLGADLIYTIANLVMTDSFSAKTQALGGGSVGIATSALIAWQITSQMDHAENATALLKGYKAGCWYNRRLSFVSVTVSFCGLRSVKRLEIKRD